GPASRAAWLPVRRRGCLFAGSLSLRMQRRRGHGTGGRDRSRSRAGAGSHFLVRWKTVLDHGRHRQGRPTDVAAQLLARAMAKKNLPTPGAGFFLSAETFLDERLVPVAVRAALGRAELEGSRRFRGYRTDRRSLGVDDSS